MMCEIYIAIQKKFKLRREKNKECIIKYELFNETTMILIIELCTRYCSAKVNRV